MRRLVSPEHARAIGRRLAFAIDAALLVAIVWALNLLGLFVSIFIPPR